MFVQFAGKKMANTCWESETACQVHRELFRIDFFFFFFYNDNQASNCTNFCIEILL